MRQLTLTQRQFDLLYDIMLDQINDFSKEETWVKDTETYKIYQKLVNLRGQS